MECEFVPAQGTTRLFNILNSVGLMNLAGSRSTTWFLADKGRMQKQVTRTARTELSNENSENSKNSKNSESEREREQQDHN